MTVTETSIFVLYCSMPLNATLYFLLFMLHLHTICLENFQKKRITYTEMIPSQSTYINIMYICL